ncbi:MAG: hypothetical protein AAFO77_02260 [Pseudomonadota bacterium]
MNSLHFAIALAGAIAAVALALLVIRRLLRKSRTWQASQEGDLAKDYPVRTDWSRSRGKVNYSSFVYFDVDRDGSYSMADRPLGGIQVRLYKNDRHVRRSITNINGFANFASSTRNRKAPLRKPGTFRFEVSVPPGWIATSDNKSQSMPFRLAPGSPAGIVGERMLTPVGLAPERWVRGSGVGDAGMEITMLKGKQKLSHQKPDVGKAFRFDVPEDADAIQLSHGTLKRVIEPGPYPIDFGHLSKDSLRQAAGTKTQKIDFCDITPDGLKKIPNGYAGLNWFNLNMMSRDFTPNCTGASNGATGGYQSCYTSSGHPAEIYSDQPFGLHSMTLTAAWHMAEGETAVITCWNGEEKLREDRIVLTTLTPIAYTPMLPSVTHVQISPAHHWQIILGDVLIVR